MAFTLEQFARNRPYSYHNTSRNNLASIRAERQLHSTAALLKASGRSDLLPIRRTSVQSVQIGSQEYFLQSQRPLHRGHIDFLDGWELSDLVKNINHRVFFWPGNIAGPIRPGKLHSESDTGPSESVVLRVVTSDLLKENGRINPLFSRYNSGSPRTNNGTKSPRGAETFSPAEKFTGGWGSVVELTFSSSVRLPPSTEVRRGLVACRREFVTTYATGGV